MIFAIPLICLFVLLVVTFMSIVDTKPFFINLRLQAINRQALLRMETDGGLTSTTKDYIIDSLSKMKGFHENKLEIKAPIANDYSFANYGEPIRLNLTYNYEPRKYSLVGWTKISTEKDKPLPISVLMETTSKRIKIIEH